MKRFAAILLTSVSLAVATVVYGAGDGHAHHAENKAQQTEIYSKPTKSGQLNSLTKMPGSGKAREANFDGRYRMEPTGITSVTSTLCAHASRGLIHVDNATWAKCGGKIEGASKGPGYYPAVYPWNEVGTGVTRTMGSMMGMKMASAEDHDDPHAGHDMSSMKNGEGGHWMAPSAALARLNPVAATSSSLKKGKAIYGAKCSVCHGVDGLGDGPAAAALTPKPANLKVMAPQHPDGGLAWKIAEGRGAMPQWKSTLTEMQIWDLVNYLKAMGKDQKHKEDGHGEHHH